MNTLANTIRLRAKAALTKFCILSLLLIFATSPLQAFASAIQPQDDNPPIFTNIADTGIWRPIISGNHIQNGDGTHEIHSLSNVSPITIGFNSTTSDIQQARHYIRTESGEVIFIEQRGIIPNQTFFVSSFVSSIVGGDWVANTPYDGTITITDGHPLPAGLHTYIMHVLNPHPEGADLVVEFDFIVTTALPIIYFDNNGVFVASYDNQYVTITGHIYSPAHTAGLVGYGGVLFDYSQTDLIIAGQSVNVNADGTFEVVLTNPQTGTHYASVADGYGDGLIYRPSYPSNQAYGKTNAWANVSANTSFTISPFEAPEPPTFTVTVTGSYATTTGAGSYLENATVTINAGTRAGYTFAGWAVNEGDVTLADASSATTTFTMPANNVAVTANWTQTPPPTFTVTVTGSHADTTGAGSYLANAVVTINAGTRAGYTFAGWTVNEGGVTLANANSATTTFTMPANNVALTVNWTQTPATFNVTVIGSHASVTGAGAYLANATVTINAGTRAGHTFAGWTVTQGGVALANVNSVTTTFTMPANNVIVTANWTQTIITLPPILPPILPPVVPPVAPPPVVTPPPPPPIIEPTYISRQDHHAFLIGFEGMIRPQGQLTRAEAATIFFRLISDEHRSQVWTQNNNFNDVSINQWFNNAISTMANDGLVVGYPDGYFRPASQITRAEFATMATRFLGLNYATPSNANPFSDIEGHWARGAVIAANNAGWLAGYEDGTFRPNQPITRAEAAAIISRVFNRLPSDGTPFPPGMITWVDNANTNAWYHIYIQSATNSYYFALLNNTLQSIGLLTPRQWQLLERPQSTPQSIFEVDLTIDIPAPPYIPQTSPPNDSAEGLVTM